MDDRPDISSGDASSQESAPRPSPLANQEAAGLQQEIEGLKARSERLLASWQRAEADLANLRRRTEIEREQMQAAAVAVVVASILPILDDMERALSSVAEPLRDFTWVDGIWLTYRKFLAILQGLEVQQMETQGKAFDPARHQAVREIEGESGKVLHVLQPGYTFRDKVLRPALVVVGKAGGQPAQQQPSGAPQDVARPG